MPGKSGFFGFGVAVTVLLGSTLFAYDGPPASSQNEVGKLVEVRQSVARGYPLSRYSSIHVYTMYFTVRTSTSTYCVQYETSVLDEVNDLRASSGRDVQVDASARKRLTMVLPDKRNIRADLAPSDQC